MKKIIISEAVTTALFIMLVIAFTWKKSAKDIELSEAAEVLNLAEKANIITEGNDMQLKRCYGLNAADYADICFFMPSNTMGVDEILIVKLKDEDQADTVLKAIESRLNSQLEAFDGYGTDQQDILNDSLIYQNGQYICLFVSTEASKWYKAFKYLTEGRL